MLCKKRAFVSGVEQSIMPVMPVEPAESKKKNKPAYEGFRAVGDVVPIEPATQMQSPEDYSALFKPVQGEARDTQLIQEEEKAQTLSYDTLTDETRQAFMQKFKLIKSRKVEYGQGEVVKTVAIIYNPHSGKKTNLVP